MTTEKRMKTHLPAWPVVATALTLAITACDSSAPEITGNTTANDGAPGSRPRTTLTFANDPNLATGGHSTPGESALRSTLASSTPTSFDDLQVLVFGPMCSGCHMGGGISQPSVMDMTTADASYAALVNTPATHSSANILVEPGNAGNSYLVQTLEGTQPSGSRMPMRSAPLSDELLAAVRTWIDNGAQR